jgi:ADP-ribosylation factor 2-binding protein
VIEEKFESMQEDFMSINCEIFEAGDRNKMEYMVIFKNYQKSIEKYIEQVLAKMLKI